MNNDDMNFSGFDYELIRYLLNNVDEFMSGETYKRTYDVSISNIAPHYSNERFNKPQTVFLAHGYDLGDDDGFGYRWVDGLTYEYSDRLRQWNYDKSDQAWEDVKENYDNDMRSAASRQDYLRLYYDDPELELVHIMAGVNVGNGYPYQIYGFKRTAESAGE